MIALVFLLFKPQGLLVKRLLRGLGMFYKETGQFKSKYKEELAAFPLFEDKIGIGILGVLTFLVIPLFGLPGLNYEFAMGAIMIPCMIFIIMTLGLNILLGFAGQISLGTGAFSGVGAYASINLLPFSPIST